MNDTRFNTTLSDRGAARRDEMLSSLKREVAARGRRRRATRAVVASAPLLLLALALIWPAAVSAPNAQSPGLAGPETRPAAPTTRSAPALTHVAFSEVRTQTDLASRTITDDQLLDLLREAGHRGAGIARRGSECFVVGVEPEDRPGPGSDASPATPARISPTTARATHSLGQ